MHVINLFDLGHEGGRIDKLSELLGVSIDSRNEYVLRFNFFVQIHCSIVSRENMCFERMLMIIN